MQRRIKETRKASRASVIWFNYWKVCMQNCPKRNKRKPNETDQFLFHKENEMYTQTALKPNSLLRNGAYGIVMGGVHR